MYSAECGNSVHNREPENGDNAHNGKETEQWWRSMGMSERYVGSVERQHGKIGVLGGGRCRELLLGVGRCL